MKKLELLMLRSFLGPFVLATLTATFILLLQYMLKYFDDLVGKDLGFMVFCELLFYFSLNMLRHAVLLGILVSALMTFGNLAEHMELASLKGGGISIGRVMRPLFIFVLIIAWATFHFSDRILPKANLKAYHLLYDIKRTKPALDIREGAFYFGIPDYVIYAAGKSDSGTLFDVHIYDHTGGSGQTSLVVADSCRMKVFSGGRYLRFRLFNGSLYGEERKEGTDIPVFSRSNFENMSLVFSLATFNLKRSQEELFMHNRAVKNVQQLHVVVDSIGRKVQKSEVETRSYMESFFFPDSPGGLLGSGGGSGSREPAYTHEDRDGGLTPPPLKSKSIENGARPTTRVGHEPDDPNYLPHPTGPYPYRIPEIATVPKNSLSPSRPGIEAMLKRADSLLGTSYIRTVSLPEALSEARRIKARVKNMKDSRKAMLKEQRLYSLEIHRKFAGAASCILMFIIGASLGSVMKKGGLGVPLLVSCFFFIIYFITGSIGSKWAKLGLVGAWLGAWTPFLALLPAGLVFFQMARLDIWIYDISTFQHLLDRAKVLGRRIRRLL